MERVPSASTFKWRRGEQLAGPRGNQGVSSYTQHTPVAILAVKHLLEKVQMLRRVTDVAIEHEGLGRRRCWCWRGVRHGCFVLNGLMI